MYLLSLELDGSPYTHLNMGHWYQDFDPGPSSGVHHASGLSGAALIPIKWIDHDRS